MSWLRRNAWWGLVFMSVVVVMFGMTDIIVGAAADEGIPRGLIGLSSSELRAESEAGYRILDFFTRSQGIVLLVLGIMSTAILLFGYRQELQWAWWTMWALPAWSAGVLILYLVAGVDPAQPPPPPMLSAPFFLVVTVAIQLISAPRFFRQSRLSP
jgi:hypothetical protein